MNNLADLYKKFMADVCAKFECSDMYKPLEQGFKSLCESYYDYDYDYDPPDYDPPGPWDDADSRTITIPFISGNPDGQLFELDEDSGDVYISFNIEAWFKLAGVTDIVPEDLSADLESEEIADAATQYTVSWDSPSQYFEDPGDGGYKYKVNIDIDEKYLGETLKSSLDACQCPEDIQAKLLAVVPQLYENLMTCDDYENDENW